MDAEAIRRKYLELGASANRTASALGITRSAVYQALERANKRAPLAVPTVKVIVAEGTAPEDRDAVAAYVRASLEAAGIQRG